VYVESSLHPWDKSDFVLTKATKTYNGKKTASSTNVAGKSGYLPAEN
jgi:hypothetical protein